MRLPLSLFLIPLLLPLSPGPAAARAYSPEDLRLIERRVHEGVNAARTAAGIPALATDARVAAVAAGHAADMARRRYFGHVTPEGRTHGARARAAGIAFARYGENILKADNPRETPPALADTILRGFLGSASHRAGLLQRDFSRTGVAVARAGNGPVVVVQNFLMPAGGVPSGGGISSAPVPNGDPAADGKARRRAQTEALLRLLLERKGRFNASDLQGTFSDILGDAAAGGALSRSPLPTGDPAAERKASNRAAGETALRLLLERRGKLRATDLEGPLGEILRAR